MESYNGDMLYNPWEVLDENGQPYTTFNEFYNG